VAPPATDEDTMHITIPADVRELLVQHQARMKERQRRERHARREALATERERRRVNKQLAESVLAFAHELAATGLLPSSGVEIFRSHRGRFTNAAHVYPDGALCVWTGSYMGGGSWRGRKPADFAAASETLLHEVVRVIETGAVWDHIRSTAQR
jgi:hypothetical protein